MKMVPNSNHTIEKMNQLKFDALSIGDDQEPVCYLCFDGGSEASQPLRRDCACRGTDAGFVHLSCLAGYAETKSKQARDMIEFRKPWRECPGCHQEYQNELAIDITTEFVSFVRRQYPHDTQMQAESLHLKLHALMKMFDRLQPVQKREAGVTANVLLSLIDRMRVVAPLSMPMRYSRFEGFAYNAHGHIALMEGTEESVRRAEVHYVNQLVVNEAIGDAEGIATAKANIAYTKSKYEGDSNIEKVLKASQELYDMRVAKYGEGNEYTIIGGKIHAGHLQDANREEEARKLLMKLLAQSKQVLGSHHNIIKDVEMALEHVISKCEFAN
jgi:hypothetical protein